MTAVPCWADPALLTQDAPPANEQATAQRLLYAAAADRGLELDSAAGDAFAGLAVPELLGTLPRPRYYPPADIGAQWFADTWASASFTFLRALVLHTTETSGWPGYAGGGSAPNFTAKPDLAGKRLMWRQHFGCDQSGRALLHPAGTVATNTSNVVQVELVGTSAQGGPGVFWPDAPDWLIAELAEFVHWLRDTWGVQAISTVRWKSYPGSYGVSNGVRLGDSAWLAYRGILAHEHVANNDHGDCGLFPAARLLDAVAQLDGADDMSQADVDAIKAYIDKKVAEVPLVVWGHKLTQAWDGADNEAGDVLTSAQRYAIEAGFAGPRPKGNAAAGTPTFAKTVATGLGLAVAQTDTLEASEAAQTAALADAAKAITDGVVSQLLGAGVAGIDEPKLRAVVGAAVHDQLAGTEFVARPAT
jgi:hypothetical protein